MPFHHVIAKIDGEDKFRCLFSDLSASDLQKRFIVPYERGKSFFSGNDLISANDLRSLHIVRTQRSDQIERDEINRADRAYIDKINRSGNGMFIISLGGGYEPQDIIQAGEDVTHTLIKGPPRFKAGIWAPSMKVLAWVGGIIAAVVAAGIVKWLGWV
jgi:hypothetical protein